MPSRTGTESGQDSGLGGKLLAVRIFGNETCAPFGIPIDGIGSHDTRHPVYSVPDGYRSIIDRLAQPTQRSRQIQKSTFESCYLRRTSIDPSRSGRLINKLMHRARIRPQSAPSVTCAIIRAHAGILCDAGLNETPFHPKITDSRFKNHRRLRSARLPDAIKVQPPTADIDQSARRRKRRCRIGLS